MNINPALSGIPQSQHTYSEELDKDYVNEQHMQAFSEALMADDSTGTMEHSEATSPGSPYMGPHTPSGRRVRKVSALSDFAPVNQIVKRRRRTGGKIHAAKRQEWLFIFLRWPLLTIIFLFIAAEFGLYVLIRQLVNTKEWLIAWRGRKGVLRKKLRSARTYQEWKDAAVALDEYLHFDEWKVIDEDPYYDWKLVRKVQANTWDSEPF
ncbi:hypothetical protein PHLCEN_2v10665 [Hermanssonia centrifuga]|uniref:Triacylglycerol lipase N-terminal domain-containing protein n=1 Tax=Hermanssonia centrifuga TaxID=98765 RepID=A0A2R6NLV6_9APHY|nr:hypothetical protein PHLCEN_2v10665 [Hermanssonia centrifuga]